MYVHGCEKVGEIWLRENCGTCRIQEDDVDGSVNAGQRERERKEKATAVNLNLLSHSPLLGMEKWSEWREYLIYSRIYFT